VANSAFIVVPLTPPSVNHYKMRTRKGVTFVSKEAKAFKDAVAIFARGQVVKGERYWVAIDVFLGKGQKGDLDNFAKCVLDGIAEAGVIHSDAAIEHLVMSKARDVEKPRTQITVKAMVK